MMDTKTLKKWYGLLPERMTLPSFLMNPAAYRKVLICLFMAIFAYQAAGICYKIMGIYLIAPKDLRTLKEEPTPPRAMAKEPAEAYKTILDRNLFGSTDRAIDDKTSAVREMPALASVLELHGTVAGEGKSGFAVLAEKGKNKQTLVKIGQQIAGATLLKVMRDEVVLRYKDKDEVLKRSAAPIASLFGPPKGNVSPPGPGRSLNISPSGTVMLSRQELQSSMKDIGQMLSQAQIRPSFSAGAPDGFIINQIQQESIFQRMGLREGDVIQSLNDKKVQTADDMITLFNTLRSAPSMHLTVKRSGKQETLTYSFQ